MRATNESKNKKRKKKRKDIKRKKGKKRSDFPSNHVSGLGFAPQKICWETKTVYGQRNWGKQWVGTGKWARKLGDRFQGPG